MGKGWVYQSMKGNLKRITRCGMVFRNIETGIIIIIAPLQRWKRNGPLYERGVTQFLYEMEYVLNGKKTGPKEEELLEMAIDLYTERAGGTDKNGGRIEATELKYPA